MTNRNWPGADSIRAARLDFDPDNDGFDYITFRVPTGYTYNTIQRYKIEPVGEHNE